MATIQNNIRWADNTAELKKNLMDGVNTLDAMRASVDRTVNAMSGTGLFGAANKVAAAIQQLGGVTKLTTYGHYVGTRYASFSNILWVNGGDYNPPNKTFTRAVAEGIRANNPSALHTAHCVRGTAALDFWSGESWLTVNDTYVSGDVADPAIAQYQQPGQMPFLLIEGYYENSVPIAQVRNQAYATVFSGGFGHCFGHTNI